MVNSVVMIACLLAAGGSSSYAQTSAQVDADTKEIAAYRLTPESLTTMMTATRVAVAEMKKDPQFQQLTNVAAEVKALEKALEDKDDPTAAEHGKLAALREQQDTLQQKFRGAAIGPSATLSDMEKTLASSPAIAAGLRAAGITSREYAKLTMALVTSGMAAGMKKAGLLKDLPPGVSAENVAFVLKHEAELEKIQKEWQSLEPGR